MSVGHRAAFPIRAGRERRLRVEGPKVISGGNWLRPRRYRRDKVSHRVAISCADSLRSPHRSFDSEQIGGSQSDRLVAIGGAKKRCAQHSSQPACSSARSLPVLAFASSFTTLKLKRRRPSVRRERSVTGKPRHGQMSVAATLHRLRKAMSRGDGQTRVDRRATLRPTHPTYSRRNPVSGKCQQQWPCCSDWR
jgi:hypothetical protein